MNDSVDNVECCFDIVAGFERNFVLSTKSKLTELQFVSTLSKGLNFATESFDIVAVCGNKVECCFDKVDRSFDNVACCFDIVAGVDGALRCDGFTGAVRSSSADDHRHGGDDDDDDDDDADHDARDDDRDKYV